jgi:type II secretory pathway pseudopilin PulG
MRAFTLVELTVSLAIIIMLTAIFLGRIRKLLCV